jgi:hypothetical protein
MVGERASPKDFSRHLMDCAESFEGSEFRRLLSALCREILDGAPADSSVAEPTPGGDAADSNRDLEKMRAAIKTCGKNTKADVLIRCAGIRKQSGYQALRRLEQLGEYAFEHKSHRR